MTQETITLAFAGDISLNGYYTTLNPQELPLVFREVRQFLDSENVDFFIANLESPLIGTGEENQLKYPRLRTTEPALQALKTLAPQALVLGNNHIFDCLENGLEKTKAWLKENQIATVGASLEAEELQKPLKIKVGGREITIFSYVAADTHPSLPQGMENVINDLEEEKILSHIRSEAGKSLVIISLHWGVEFSHYPSPNQREMARRFVEAGADIIMGHHPHALQGYEQWKQGHIFYSLGNFAFADVTDCSPPVLWTQDQRHGAIALVRLEADGKTQVQLQPTYTDGCQVKIESDRKWAKKAAARSRVLEKTPDSYQKFWKRYQFLESVVKPPFRYFFGERKSFFRQIQTLRPRHLRKIYNYFVTFASRTHP